MKKVLAVMACFSMVLLLAACGEKREKVYAGEPENVVVERGHWNAGVYTSDFAELTFPLPDGWQIVDEATLEQSYTNDTTIADMACQKGGEGTSKVVVSYEDLLETKGTYAITEEDYLSEAAALYESYGFEVTENEERVLSGNKYRLLGIHAATQDQELSIYFMVRKIGHYMLSVNFAFENDEEQASILESLQ